MTTNTIEFTGYNATTSDIFRQIWTRQRIRVWAAQVLVVSPDGHKTWVGEILVLEELPMQSSISRTLHPSDWVVWEGSVELLYPEMSL